MSRLHEVADDEIDIDLSNKEVIIILFNDELNSVYLKLSFDQIKRIASKIEKPSQREISQYQDISSPRMWKTSGEGWGGGSSRSCKDGCQWQVLEGPGIWKLDGITEKCTQCGSIRSRPIDRGVDDVDGPTG